MPQQLDIETVTTDQLGTVNAIVAAAVQGWPMAARLKRVAVGVLSYDTLDLREMEMLLARSAVPRPVSRRGTRLPC